jgi:hypothetical protein
MQNYIASLRLIVDRALKNSGFDKQPVYIDRVLNRVVTTGQIKDKGNVARRV